MADDSLFQGFDSVDKSTWIAKIEKDLKGKPYSDLIKENSSGIEIEAVYTSQDIQLGDEAPGSDSFRRGSKSENNNWRIDELVELSDDPKANNKKILELLNQGVDGLSFHGNPSGGSLNEVLPQYIHLGFDSGQDPEVNITAIRSAFGEEENSWEIYLNYDPIGQGALDGNFSADNILSGITAINELKSFKKLRVFTVHADRYHNAGGNAVSELAFALAHAHEYIHCMVSNGLTIEKAARSIKVNLASGRDYFQEIAKVRAFQVLWSTLIKSYGVEDSESCSALTQSTTSQFLSTLYDPHNNMLRATTQCMAAALGGSRLIRVLPYDTAWSKGDDFSKRIARNTQLLLKEESYFDKVIDPAGGSYYIEQLTNKLAEMAWTKFKKIEAKGGFIGLMTSGNLARELGEDLDEQLQLFQGGSTNVLGVNLYPNPDERKIDVLQEVDNGVENKQSEFTPIQLVRLTGSAEEIRLNEELKEAQS